MRVVGRRCSRRVLASVLALAALATPGCGTILGLGDGYGPYKGVRADMLGVGVGIAAVAVFPPFVLLVPVALVDLPISFVADTVLLPYGLVRMAPSPSGPPDTPAPPHNPTPPPPPPLATSRVDARALAILPADEPGVSTLASATVVARHRWAVRVLALSPDGAKLASGSIDSFAVHSVALLPLASPRELWSGRTCATSLEFTDGGDTLAVTGIGGAVSRFDAADGSAREDVRPAAARRGPARRVHLPSLRGEAAWRLLFQSSPWWRNALGPDGVFAVSPGETAVAIARQGRAAVLDTETAPIWSATPGWIEPRAVVWSPDGERVAFAGPRVVVVKPRAGKTCAETLARRELGATCLAFAPDSRTLAVGSSDGVIRLYESETGRALLRLTEGRASAGTSSPVSVVALAYTPDGKRLFAALGTRVVAWELPASLAPAAR